MNSILKTLLALLCLTSMAAAVEPTKAKTIIVFGDSITAGGALPKDQQSKLWLKLVTENSGGKVSLVNEGKGGRPTDSVKEFEAMITRHAKPDGLAIALGMNDSRDVTDACVPKAVANIQAMIKLARAAWGADLRVLVIGPSNIRKDALGPSKPIADQREAKLREQGAAFAKLAHETQSQFTSLFGKVPAASLGKDGVHPDGAGNEAIAKALLPAFLELAR